MRNDKPNPIVDMTVDFAVKIIDFTKQLESDKNFDIARQMFRSGTSIGANVREAQNAESKADFIHKMKIAAKEADETTYWLELCRKSHHLPENSILENKVLEINKVLSKIIAS